MSEQFKVGEVLVGQNHVVHTDRNGMQCEVLGELRMRTGRSAALGGALKTSLQYLVQWADGRVWNAAPQYLRRRKPPVADSGERMIAELIRETLDRAPQRVGEPA